MSICTGRPSSWSPSPALSHTGPCSSPDPGARVLVGLWTRGTHVSLCWARGPTNCGDMATRLKQLYFLTYKYCRAHRHHTGVSGIPEP